MTIPLSVILPVRDERDSVATTIESLKKCGLPAETEILVVDDGSSDGSGELAAKAGARVIATPGRGYGAALMTGFQNAAGGTLAFMDADATYPPQALAAMWRHPEREQAMLIANRFGGHSRMPWIRKAGNRALTALAQWRTRAGIADLCSGQRMFPRAWLEDFEGLPDGLHFSPAMTLRAFRRGRTLLYLPADYHERDGRSKLKLFTDGLLFLRETLKG